MAAVAELKRTIESGKASSSRSRPSASGVLDAAQPARPRRPGRDDRGGRRRPARGRASGRSSTSSRATTSTSAGSWPDRHGGGARGSPARASPTSSATSSCSSWPWSASPSTSSAAGPRPVVPPVLVREEALVGTGFLPGDREQIYEVPKDELFLVGTSEVSLAALHAGEILEADELPLRYAGFSPASAARPAPPARTRAASSASTSSTRSRCSRSSSRGSRGARAAARDRGAHPRRARDPLPRRQHRGRRPRRPGGEEVRLRGLDPEPGPLPRADLVLEHDRLPGAAPRLPLPADEGASPEVVHTLNGTAVAVGGR